MAWPWRRFEAFYQSSIKRDAVEDMRQRRNLMIAACHSNTNWDGEEQQEKRTEYLSGLEEQYQRAVTMIYTGVDPDEEKIDPNDPFMKAGREALDKMNLPPAPETPRGLDQIEIEAG